MKKYNLVSCLHFSLGLLGAVAITTELIKMISAGNSLVNFFSFFTIESNILTVLLLFTLALSDPKKTKGKYDFIRGAITLYMTMTGIIYIILLSDTQSQLVPWVNMILHYIMPFSMLLLWILFPHKNAIPYKKALLWLAFPLAYFTYTLIRGSIVGWYPYPFLDVAVKGWGSVVSTSVIIFVGVLILIKILTFKPRQRSI
jgi:hypothetical protein